MRVLIAEDDERLAELLLQSVMEAGGDAEVFLDGLTALDAAAPGGYGSVFDVILLDWMLPGLDGVTVCRRLRRLGSRTPVLMLTARGAVKEKIAGLDAGADDYLTKPFDLDELLARLRALHRRSGADLETPAVYVDGLTVDPATRRVTREGHEIQLSAREFDILHLLVEQAGRLVTRYRILDEVWDGETDIRSTSLMCTSPVFEQRLTGPSPQTPSPLSVTSATGSTYPAYDSEIEPSRQAVLALTARGWFLGSHARRTHRGRRIRVLAGPVRP